MEYHEKMKLGRNPEAYDFLVVLQLFSKNLVLKCHFFRNEKTLRKLSIEAITARALMKIL